MEQALDQWQHPVALSEATDVLHWAMRSTSYCGIRVAIEIARVHLHFLSPRIICFHIT
jgi:hypothetical protein